MKNNELATLARGVDNLTPISRCWDNLPPGAI